MVSHPVLWRLATLKLKKNIPLCQLRHGTSLWQNSSPQAVTAVGPEVAFPREPAKHSAPLCGLTMGTISSPTAQHQPARGRGEVLACFPRVSIIRPAIQLLLLFSFPLFTFNFLCSGSDASLLRDIIRLEIQHFSTSRLAHALWSGLISHLLSALSAAQLIWRAALRLARRVERMLQNERRQRLWRRSDGRRDTSNRFTLLRCFDRKAASSTPGFRSQCKTYLLTFLLTLKHTSILSARMRCTEVTRPSLPHLINT